MTAEEHTPRLGFWISATVGIGIMAVGVRGLVTQLGPSARAEVGRWIVGADVLHDLALAPAVGIIGLALGRVRRPWRAPLQAGLFASAIVIAVVWPALRGYGRASVPDNPSLEPLDYATALATVLGVIWGLIACWILSLVVRHHPRHG